MRKVVGQILFAKKKLPILVMISNTVPTPFVASASSELDSFRQAWRAYDGSFTEVSSVGFWASVSVPASITIDYGAIYAFSKVEITGRSTIGGQAPNTFELQSSNDGIIFTAFDSYTGQVWSLGETKTFTFLPVKARYLRIAVSTVNGSSIVSIILINWS